MNEPGQMILVYDPSNGMGRYTIEFPWAEGTEDAIEARGDFWVYAEIGSVDRVHVSFDDEDNPVANVRVEGPWVAGTSNLPSDGLGEFKLTKLPKGSIVAIGTEQYTVDDGKFSFSSETAGSYVVNVYSWPFLPSMYEVQFE